MELGVGTGGSTAVDRTRLRWLIMLLAMLLAIAGTLVAATPGQAEYEEEEEEEVFYCGEVTPECDDFPFSNQIWEAVFNCDCDAVITVREPAEGDVADIEVETTPSDAEFELIVTVDKGEGPAPGLARVDKDDEGDLDRCRGNNDTDCVKVKRISGARTEYTVKIDEDPRFRFR